MKKAIVMMTMAALTAAAANAADVSASVDFASAYIFRGVTLNNGLVMQPGAEVSGLPIPEEFGSLAAGIWGNYDIDDEDGDGSDMSEIDYYISYSLPITVVDLGVSYTEYTYPQSGSSNDKEIGVSIGKGIGDSGVYTSFAANYGVGGAIDEVWYLQGGVDYGMDLSDALSLSAGVTVGYIIAEDAPDGFNDATASVGLSYALNDNWSVNGSLVYVAQLDDDVLTDSAYDKAGYASVGLSCDF